MAYIHLSYKDRLRIEFMYNKLHFTTVQIGIEIGKHNATISRELRRGFYECYGKDYLKIKQYSADIAQADYDYKSSLKGASLKLGKDYKFAKHVENKIVNENYSPRAVLGEIKADKLEFDTTISHTTLYRYIDSGCFGTLSNSHLPVGKRTHAPYRKVTRYCYSNVMRSSIDERPCCVLLRGSVGHWEMDTVVGKAKGLSTCLLVLTERKTRYEIILKLKRNTSSCVVRALDKLQRRYGKNFRHIFKSITVDNGSEFSDTKGMERSNRTKIYYCHPYSSWERGSNENANKLIRRFIPKGTDIQPITHKEIQELELWINNYPRQIHGWKSAQQLFSLELQTLLAS